MAKTLDQDKTGSRYYYPGYVDVSRIFLQILQLSERQISAELFNKACSEPPVADPCGEVTHSRAPSPISCSLAAQATRVSYQIARATLSALPQQPQEREVDARGLLPCHCSCRCGSGAGKGRAVALRGFSGMVGWSQGTGPLHPCGALTARAQPCWLVSSRLEQHSSQVSLSAGPRGVGEEDGKRRAML